MRPRAGVRCGSAPRWVGAVLLCCAVAGCSFVNESYATVGSESINGADVFVKLLEDYGTVHTVARVSDRVLRRADVLVHFETRSQPKEYYERAETWLLGDKLLLNPPGPEEKPGSGKTNRSGKGSDSKDEPDTRGDPNAGASDSKDGDAVGKKEDKDSGVRKPTEPEYFEAPKRKRTLLYLVRDTDASIRFWRRLARDMRGAPREEAWAKAELARREQRGRMRPGAGPLLFGSRLIRFPRARLLPTRGPLGHASLRWPTRMHAGPVRSQSGRSLRSRSDLEATGVPAVRTILAPRARIVAVYNADLLLNYSLVRPPARAFADRLLDRVFRRDGRPLRDAEIYLINGSLLPRTANTKDDSLLRVFRVFPLNFLLLHLVLLLVLFLFSRWPHERTPLEVAPRGTRAFLEHIEALGARLARSRGRRRAVHSIGRLLERQAGTRRYGGTGAQSAAAESDAPADGSPSSQQSEIKDDNHHLLAEAARYWENEKR